MGIFFSRIDGRSALIGFATGTAFLFFVNLNTNISFWLYGAIGIVSTVLVAWLASLILPNQKEIKGLTWKTIEK